MLCVRFTPVSLLQVYFEFGSCHEVVYAIQFAAHMLCARCMQVSLWQTCPMFALHQVMWCKHAWCSHYVRLFVANMLGVQSMQGSLLQMCFGESTISKQLQYIIG